MEGYIGCMHAASMHLASVRPMFFSSTGAQDSVQPGTPCAVRRDLGRRLALFRATE
jgi:hypothetical protein